MSEEISIKAKQTVQKINGEVYFRISRATPEQKEDIKKLIKECLNLQIELFSLNQDLEEREKTNTPLSINPNWHLPENPVTPPKIVLSGSIPKTESVKEENTLDVLIPFYRQAANEFYNAHKIVPLEVIEQQVLKLQDLTRTELEAKRDSLKTVKEKLIYYGLLQEKFSAVEFLNKAFELTGISPKNRLEKLEPFKPKHKQAELWLLCMNKLKAEGYGYFEANLACNHFLHFVNMPKIPDTLNLTSLEREKTFAQYHKDVEEWQYGDAETTPFLETNCPYSMDSNVELDIWKGKDRLNTARKEQIYIKNRKAELQKEAAERKWRKEVREWLISLIQEGHGRLQVILDCHKAGYPEAFVDEVLKIYEGLQREGFVMKLKTKPVEDSSITIESDSKDTSNKEVT